MIDVLNVHTSKYMQVSEVYKEYYAYHIKSLGVFTFYRIHTMVSTTQSGKPIECMLYIFIKHLSYATVSRP